MTWDELVEKVKNIEGFKMVPLTDNAWMPDVIVTEADWDRKRFTVNELSFNEDGSISFDCDQMDSYYSVYETFARNRTPAQMHRIILALTEDEK